jgi:putative DNA primase/helicase
MNAAPVGFGNIPAELRALPQWVNWKIEQRDGKDTKVPYQPNGKRASSTDPRTWSTFERVCRSNGDLAGHIGFVFTKEAGYVGIDVDHCRNAKTGITEQWALSIITALERLSEKYGDEIRYCSDRRVWCVWDGSTWNVSDAGAISRRMQQIGLDIYGEAAAIRSEKQRKRLAEWARQTESRRTQDNSIALARYIDGIEVREFSEVFDTYPMLLNVRNGTIDLRTGELLKHDRKNFLTKIVPIDYDADADCPDFRDFIKQILPGDGLALYLMKIAGYCLTGKTSEQKWWMFHGVTASGKSTLINILHGLLGPYALALPEHFFLITNSGKDYTMANLVGVRLATCVETNEGKRLDVAKIKMLTGEDVISAELKYQNQFQFRSQAKLILATNNKPHVSASDDATWRRLQLVPFNVSVKEKDRIPDFAARLVDKEASGILGWAVLGCKALSAGQFGAPETVLDASKDYRKDEDVVQTFLNDCCVLEGEINRQELYTAYANWCKENHFWKMNKIPFAKDVARLGETLGIGEDDGKHKWLGVRLKQIGD